ncbi:A24 family peptidase [Budvicia diplopodorum]|uniref:A24 family peptidase n=1 Tax=Budvicia diplopodorum TaxID=1119056 RepID=UPI00135806A4|nr:prepilin peptidase [Budvicia diplopodorum]
MTTLINGIFLVMLMLLIWTTYTDIRFRIISNKVVTAILIVAILFGYYHHSTINILAAVSLLALGFVLFNFNILGAGDVKLISALSLSLTAQQIWPFLWLTSVSGGLIVFIGFLFFRRSICQSGVPMGPAIAVGFFFASFIT